MAYYGGGSSGFGGYPGGSGFGGVPPGGSAFGGFPPGGSAFGGYPGGYNVSKYLLLLTERGVEILDLLFRS